jgi:hypothetical protein
MSKQNFRDLSPSLASGIQTCSLDIHEPEICETSFVSYTPIMIIFSNLTSEFLDTELRRRISRLGLACNFDVTTGILHHILQVFHFTRRWILIKVSNYYVYDHYTT